ncbi:MAG: NAD-dependent epimerase/dehydratase family protein, partial [Trebonia sp.]
EYSALAFANVYGPRQDPHGEAGVVAIFAGMMLDRSRPTIFGDGQQTRDFVFIEDLVRALRLAATVPDIGGETFQIATSAESSIGELVEKLLPALDEAGIPPPELRHTAPSVGAIQRKFSDTGKARDRLGWQAEIKLSEGLRRTVAWFVERSRNGAATAA